MMLYGYKKTTSEGEAENPCFYLTSVEPGLESESGRMEVMNELKK